MEDRLAATALQFIGRMQAPQDQTHITNERFYKEQDRKITNTYRKRQEEVDNFEDTSNYRRLINTAIIGLNEGYKAKCTNNLNEWFE